MTPPDYVEGARAAMREVETEDQLRQWREDWLDTETYQLHLDADAVNELDKLYDRKLAHFWGVHG